MNHYKNLIKELEQKNKADRLTKGIKIAKEQAIFKDLMEEQGKCRRCEIKEDLTLDHIIPESLLEIFGMDIRKIMVPGNYQLLCRRCNRFKANRLDFAYLETRELLIKLINDIPIVK